MKEKWTTYYFSVGASIKKKSVSALGNTQCFCQHYPNYQSTLQSFMEANLGKSHQVFSNQWSHSLSYLSSTGWKPPAKPKQTPDMSQPVSFDGWKKSWKTFNYNSLHRCSYLWNYSVSPWTDRIGREDIWCPMQPTWFEKKFQLVLEYLTALIWRRLLT